MLINSLMTSKGNISVQNLISGGCAQGANSTGAQEGASRDGLQGVSEGFWGSVQERKGKAASGTYPTAGWTHASPELVGPTPTISFTA